MDERNESNEGRLHQDLCAYLLGELDPEQRTEVEAALAADPELRAERARLERAIGLVRELAIEAPALSEQRRAQLAAAVPAARRGARRWVAAAAVLVLGGGAAVAFGSWPGAETDRTDPGGDESVARAPAADRTSEDDSATVASGGTEALGPQVDPAAPARESDAEDPAVSDVAIEPTLVAARPELVELAETWEYDGSWYRFLAVGNDGKPVAGQPDQMRGMVTLSQSDPAATPPTSFDVFSVGAAANGSIALPRIRAMPVEADPGVALFGAVGGGGGGSGDRSGAEMYFEGVLGGAGAPQAGDATRLGVELGDRFFGEAGVAEKRSAGDLAGLVVGHGWVASADQPLDLDALFQRCRPQPGERPRDMFFRFWGDNGFVLTRQDALATFAADVDTASFVLARRYLRDGQLPERAQIRTEEFVNYFDADLTPPAEGDFAIHAELAPSPFGGSDARWLLRVGVRAREIPADKREPLVLTFVIDTSGSMRKDNRLELVKHAMRTLVSQLDGRDRIGIVSFAQDARLVLPITVVEDKDRIAEVIDSLSPNGGTNAESGLWLGYELAATALDPEAHNRVVLLSDGVANIGQTDQDRINADVRERRESGIYLNTIGVGMDNHNDTFLEQLADKGDGVCDYVDDSRAVHRAIVERFTGAFQPVASDVKIQVEFADGAVLRWRQIGYENRAVADDKFRDDTVDAGEVGSGHQVTALFELESARSADAGASPDVAADQPWATVRVRWLPPRRAGDDPSARTATELELHVDGSALRATFDGASAGFQRAAAVAQFAEVLRRSSHAAGDSYAALKDTARRVAMLPAFAGDDETVELVSLVQRAEELGITRELQRSDLAQAVDEYQRHHYLRHQLAALEGEPSDAALESFRRQNDLLEQRIRELARGR